MKVSLGLFVEFSRSPEAQRIWNREMTAAANEEIGNDHSAGCPCVFCQTRYGNEVER